MSTDSTAVRNFDTDIQIIHDNVNAVVESKIKIATRS
jgi:hypothetical protein